MSQNKDKILFFRESTFKVAELIFNFPNKTFHVRLLEKETGFSTTAVNSSVEELADYSIVKIEETPITKNIKADLESDAYRFYKQIFNLYRLRRYQIINNLVKAYNNPKAIVLFGSFAKGEDIEESDVDLLIITNNKPEEFLNKSIIRIEKILNRKISIHAFPNLDNSSAEFKNAVTNGIVLHGYLKVI
ncbi:MAG: nucleotidyltransferase domain-containing protein [archaeon]